MLMDTINFITYRNDILTQWGTMASMGVIFDDDVGSSSSYDSPSLIKETKEDTLPNIDTNTHDVSNLGVDEVSIKYAFILYPIP